MINIDFELKQGSNEWLEQRTRLITATDAYDLLQGMAIPDILAKKANNRFAGSASTARGHELEDEARQLYSKLNHVEIQEAGFITNDKYPQAAISPDGFFGLPNNEIALIEVKSFLHKHHQELHKNSDAHVWAQIQFQLLITEAPFVDLVQYNPDEANLMDVFITQRIFPDMEVQEKLKRLLANPIDTPDITQTAQQLVSLEQEAQFIQSQIADQLQDFQTKQQQIQELKTLLKERTTGKVSQTLELDGNKLSISIYDVHRVQVSDASLVSDEFQDLEEIFGVIERDGKFFHKTPNTKLVQNYVKAGKQLPAGFEDKTSRSIRIIFNGKTL